MMKASDKGIILGVVFAVVLAGFYFKALSPKREKASQLNDDIALLKSDIGVQEQNAAYGEDARQRFPTYYGRMVVLGKAVPSQAETASLLVELNSISGHADVKFQGIELSEGSAATASSSSTAPAAAPTAASSTPTPATEASVASAPLGSSVGPGGLLTLPYSLSFTGTFFDVADFFSGLDSLNHLRDGGAMVAADGRLVTVDGFSLSPPDSLGGPTPVLKVNLAVTAYVTPGAQGLTAGATPIGPAPSVTQPQAQPASATVSP
jgi:Tfp pilus assembly protein PilO